ncbi:MAG: transcriptional repressor [Myxococcota bacterium]
MSESDDPRARLRAVRLRATPPRIAVLAHLDRQRSPVSHPELCAALAPEGWDRGTLYRNLADLTRVGLVRKRDLGDHLWRYEVVERGPGQDEIEHPHFLCTRCGAVACLPEFEVRVPSGDVPRALTLGTYQIQVHGVCDECLK